MIELSVVNSDGNSDISVVNPTIIKIIGCGGGGSNAVNRMIEAGVKDVEFAVMNTDLQALNSSKAQKRLAIGQKKTGGLGAGGNPAVGEEAAKEDTDSISNLVQGSDMVVITAGMGGGTGTGSAPVVAELAKASGALTVAVVTTPFGWEGPVRMSQAKEGIKKLRANVDSLIVVPNDQLSKITQKRLSFKSALKLADEVLCQGVQGISEIITLPGVINIDFADVRTAMQGKGDAILGVGFGEGENRAVDAAQAAISNPLLVDCQIDGASTILVNVIGDDSEDYEPTLAELEDIVKTISASAAKNVHIISGIATKPGLGDRIAVTVIATGFNRDEEPAPSVQEVTKKRSENVLDYGAFDKIVRSGPAPVAQAPKIDPASDSKLSTIAIKPENLEAAKKAAGQFSQPGVRRPVASGISPTEEKKQPSPGYVEGMQPPHEINKDDITQPAAWRGLDNLSRSINLN